ncbi:MAG: Deoxyadenosine/deoxycytidine kinase [Calditrichaeota bacterium]|nr:Deoxyadenosine/deoxycytidine kinase [Calditrichota bacterium]
MNHFIAVAGNIGVGKTTVTRKIADSLGWRPYFEPVIDNPYLDDFYADMKRWSFHLQIYFLSRRFESQKEISESPVSCVQDRSIYEDVEIFARTLNLQGFLNARDYENYRALFAQMVSYLRKPDVILYLRADVDTLLRRIRERGRGSEKKIRKKYLAELNRAYEGWASRARKRMHVLTIDAGEPNSPEKVAEEAVEEMRSLFGLFF